MTWIITNTGRAFDLLNPAPQHVSPVDIAHALSMICRFNGHCFRHYSVAQHSLLVADIVKSQGHDAETQLYALLHDAAEAYVGDLVRPLKHYLRRQAIEQSDYDVIEEAVWHAICEHFDLEPEQPECIRTADMIALATERRDLLPDHPMAWECLRGITPHAVTLDNWEPRTARDAFHVRLLDLLTTTHRARAAA